MNPTRRCILVWPWGLLWPFHPKGAVAQVRSFAAAKPDLALQFPRDHGAHPEFRTEWWYLTGLLQSSAGDEFGFQVTFFRRTSEHPWPTTNAFAPNQFIIAHAAISDPANAKFHHEERAARATHELAGASQAQTDVWIGNWRLQLHGERYRIEIPGKRIRMALIGDAGASPILLQGEGGWSQKGPHPENASHYYSRPHIQIQGSIRLHQRIVAVTGRAWLDHEWSSDLLANEIVGWDWIGIHLTDGGALMAFRTRQANGQAAWSAAALRNAQGHVQQWRPAQVRWIPTGIWQSPTGASYPRTFTVEIADTRYTVVPRFMEQEVDARRSTGIIYWEGLVDLLQGTRRIGSGYLEMTGYARPLRW